MLALAALARHEPAVLRRAPQEAQIARLAADEETNPAIGSRLFISPRTVEYRLSKVFVRRDVKSRRELRGALH